MNFVRFDLMTPAHSSDLTAGNPLWDFAVDVYAKPGVEQACLALQDRLGADVTMLMFCLWVAERGRPEQSFAHDLGAAIKLSRDWQRSFVEPLRTCRTNFKAFIANTDMGGAEHDAATDLRERIKQCELDMERLQMLALYSLVAEDEAPVSPAALAQARRVAAHNLEVYFSATGVKLDPLGQAHVQTMLQAVFG